jgi:hypothetical protein
MATINIYKNSCSSTFLYFCKAPFEKILQYSIPACFISNLARPSNSRYLIISREKNTSSYFLLFKKLHSAGELPRSNIDSATIRKKPLNAINNLSSFIIAALPLGVP